MKNDFFYNLEVSERELWRREIKAGGKKLVWWTLEEPNLL